MKPHPKTFPLQHEYIVQCFKILRDKPLGSLPLSAQRFAYLKGFAYFTRWQPVKRIKIDNIDQINNRPHLARFVRDNYGFGEFGFCIKEGGKAMKRAEVKIDRGFDIDNDFDFVYHYNEKEMQMHKFSFWRERDIIREEKKYLEIDVIGQVDDF